MDPVTAVALVVIVVGLGTYLLGRSGGAGAQKRQALREKEEREKFNQWVKEYEQSRGGAPIGTAPKSVRSDVPPISEAQKAIHRRYGSDG